MFYANWPCRQIADKLQRSGVLYAETRVGIIMKIGPCWQIADKFAEKWCSIRWNQGRYNYENCPCWQIADKFAEKWCVLYAETRVGIIMKIGPCWQIADKFAEKWCFIRWNQGWYNYENWPMLTILQPFIRSRKLLQLHTLVLNFTLKSWAESLALTSVDFVWPLPVKRTQLLCVICTVCEQPALVCRGQQLPCVHYAVSAPVSFTLMLHALW